MGKEDSRELDKILGSFVLSIALICSLHPVHSPERYKAFSKSRSKILKRIERLTRRGKE